MQKQREAKNKMEVDIEEFRENIQAMLTKITNEENRVTLGSNEIHKIRAAIQKSQEELEKIKQKL
jgi:hypothetical protein